MKKPFNTSEIKVLLVPSQMISQISSFTTGCTYEILKYQEIVSYCSYLISPLILSGSCIAEICTRPLIYYFIYAHTIFHFSKILRQQHYSQTTQLLRRSRLQLKHRTSSCNLVQASFRIGSAGGRITTNASPPQIGASDFCDKTRYLCPPVYFDSSLPQDITG